MRAAVVREPKGRFNIEDLRMPQPGPGEIRVKVVACGVCHTDLHVRDGAVAFPLPAVFGHEVSGVVDAVGAGVESLQIGQQVVGAFIMPCGDCSMCNADRQELCESFFSYNRLKGTLYDGATRLHDRGGRPIAMYSMGGLAEYAVMPELAAAPIPDGAALADAAILGCAFLTAYGALVHVGQVTEETTVVVLGTGGVGLAAIALAKALGVATLVAVDVADDRLETASQLGASHVVNASNGNAVDEVRGVTDGGAMLVLEAIGNPVTFRQATEMAADGGRCVMVGIAPTGVTAEVEITRLVRRKIQILGSFGGRPRSDLAHLAELVTTGRLDPGALISRRFKLDEVDVAYRLLEDGKIVGRAVVEMTD